MLDVVFILLVFFVVTASLIRDHGLDVTLPAGLAFPGTPVESITARIEADDSFHINGRVLSRGSLAPMIRRLVAEYPGAKLSAEAAPESHVDAMAAAVDAAPSAGFGVVPIHEFGAR